jgi:hypothetical protein
MAVGSPLLHCDMLGMPLNSQCTLHCTAPLFERRHLVLIKWRDSEARMFPQCKCLSVQWVAHNLTQYT